MMLKELEVGTSGEMNVKREENKSQEPENDGTHTITNPSLYRVNP